MTIAEKNRGLILIEIGIRKENNYASPVFKHFESSGEKIF